MQEKYFNNQVSELITNRYAVYSDGVSWFGRLIMLALNFWPTLHIVLILICLQKFDVGWLGSCGIVIFLLYLLPPIAARMILSFTSIPQGSILVGGKLFFVWWALFQLQVIFCRLSFLEEILRLLPGAYSFWLRLWGARIGRLTYWSPGVVITDRSFLVIGNNVVLGASVRLNAHVLERDKKGRSILVLADVKVGDRAVVGGYCLLTAGTEVFPGETTHACQLFPPFSVWKEGRRIKRIYGL
jgi:hypothetical protein